jgi:hypothetical protein
MNTITEPQAALTPDQRSVLQAIYDRFRIDGTWPTFITVDRPLRRSGGLDTGAVVQQIPESLLLRPRPGNFRPGPSDPLRLTVPGIAACDGSRDDVENFVRLLRWLAQKELEHEPADSDSSVMPRSTSEEARQYLRIPEADPVPLRRLYAMLQLDHWGLSGTGGTPDDWYVSVGPDIWRYRDVQSASDCAAARKNWLSEGAPFDTSDLEAGHGDNTWPGDDSTAVEPAEAETADDPGYYHVRISVKSRPRDEVRLDLAVDELADRFLQPYREGRPIVTGGRTVPMDDLTKIRISRTDHPSADLRATVQAERRRQAVVAPVSEDWLIANRGADVTDSFITEPPGRLAVALAAPLLVNPPRRPAPYIDESLIAAIQAKEAASRFDCTKLLGLLREVNDNVASENPYGAHALVRAVLDHIPPILGYKTFAEVVNNYRWSQTDKRYLKRLLDFKLQGDDVLHRQISERADLLGVDDLPPRALLNRLVQECAERM